MDLNFYSKEEALREACSIGNTDVVNKLLNEGVEVNSQHKINGWTSLHWAAKRGHASIVSMLLKHGADPTVKTHKDETAFSFAVDDKVADLLHATESGHQYMSKSEPARNGDSKMEVKDGYEFVPSYLKHPVFPHTQQMDIPVNNERTYQPGSTSGRSVEAYKNYQQVTSAEASELVLKVRVAGNDDFIEIELNCSDLTFENLLKVSCEELEVARESVVKVRKLPNTILRKDKDIKRLQQFQELELVLNDSTSVS